MQRYKFFFIPPSFFAIFLGLFDILPSVSRDLTIVDGVDRTVMIACQTTGTPSVVNPHRGHSFDVIHRADLGALATADAYILIHHKLTVSDHVFVEIAANHVGVESGSGTLLQFLDTPFVVSDDGDDMAQLVLGVLNLPEFLVLGVGVHERQTDVRLWHDDGEERFCLKTYGTQFLVEDGHALAHVVAAGGEGPTEGIATIYLQSLDEVADDPWGLPAVRGETETNALIFL